MTKWLDEGINLPLFTLWRRMGEWICSSTHSYPWHWSASCPGCCRCGERTLGTHWIVTWVASRATWVLQKKKNLLLLSGPEPGSFWACSPVTVLTLSQHPPWWADACELIRHHIYVSEVTCQQLWHNMFRFMGSLQILEETTLVFMT